MPGHSHITNQPGRKFGWDAIYPDEPQIRGRWTISLFALATGAWGATVAGAVIGAALLRLCGAP